MTDRASDPNSLLILGAIIVIIMIIALVLTVGAEWLEEWRRNK